MANAGAHGSEASVVSLHIAREAKADMESVPEVRAVAGRGLEGDRYFARSGTFSRREGADRQVTLIEVEAIEALARDYDMSIAPGEARRNVVTRGVALNHLVDRTFRVGEVRMRGLRLCEPCRHLARLVQADVVPGLVHRGGLRAEILEGGFLRVGDPVVGPPG